MLVEFITYMYANLLAFGCETITIGLISLIHRPLYHPEVKFMDNLDTHRSNAQQRDGDDTIRHDTRCYFNVRTKAGISQLNLPPETKN